VQGFLVDLSDRLELQAEHERLTRARAEARAEALARRQRLDLAVETGETLAGAADVETALGRVAALTVRDFADWCAVDLRTEDEDGLVRLTAAHAELILDGETRDAAPEAVPTADVQDAAARGEPTLSADRLRLLVPMVARGHTLGALSFVRGAGARRYGADDLALAADIARRVALTLDAAHLHQRVELEADAARVLAYVADGVFLVDRTGVIRLWNPAAEAITGYVSDAMIGNRPSEAIPGWENFREQIPVAGEAGPAAPESVWIETDEGQRWISISAVEFFGGTVYAFRDVTEAHRLEELKGDFVATASHELRTPLAAVYGAAQTLRRHDFALDEAGRERFVSMIVDEADRLSRIVNEILLATQLDGAGVDLAAELFDPRDLVNRVAEATRSHLRPEITLDVAASAPVAEVAADRDKVRQVLVNLVDNAVKYSPSGGRVELGVAPAGTSVRFSVRDEGLGIPTDEQDRIFEKFYRLDPAMTRGVGGTGLGLYICHELVRRMGGRIWVESTHGEGSTFSFELPAAVPAGAAARDQTAPARV
jgi:PAS domain S-box-containing protein